MRSRLMLEDILAFLLVTGLFVDTGSSTGSSASGSSGSTETDTGGSAGAAYTGSKGTLMQTKDLYEHLFTTQKYNKFIRPIADQGTVLNVSIAFYLTSIIAFDEQSESLTTSGYLSMHWLDDALKWNKSYYEATLIYVPQDELWKPDVSLRNSFKTFTGLGSSYLNAWVYPNGEVLWTPFQLLTSTCEVDITYFPFDTQTCKLQFIAWSYTKAYVRLIVDASISGKVFIDTDFTDNSQWLLVDSEATESVFDSQVTYTIKLQRKATFYVMNIIVPVIILSFLSIFTFALPVSSGERSSFGITLFLSLAVFLTIVASELPKNSDVMSRLSIYLVAMAILSTMISLTSVLEIRLAQRETSRKKVGPFFRFIYRLGTPSKWFSSSKKPPKPRRQSKVSILKVNQPCSRKTSYTDELRVVTHDRDASGSGIDVKHDVMDHKERLTWVEVVDAMDFVLFWTFMTVVVVSTTTFFALTVVNPQSVENFYAKVHDYGGTESTTGPKSS